MIIRHRGFRESQLYRKIRANAIDDFFRACTIINVSQKQSKPYPFCSNIPIISKKSVTANVTSSMSTGKSKSEPLSARLKKLSKQELNKRDVFGRTIIHIICILGRFDLLKYLLQNNNLIIFIVDYESGWTGLHHSIFYGKISCARLLLDNCSDLIKVKDRNGLTAIDIYHLKYSYQNLNIFPSSIGVHDTNYSSRKNNDNVNTIPDKIWWDRDIRGGSEVFTFGINVNNHLGTGDSDDKLNTPHRVNIENKRLQDYTLSIADRLVKPRIKEIKISKNHSVLLTNEHKQNILVAGNPSRGRLGHGSSVPNYRFTHLDYFTDEHIIDVAISDDHTLALTSDGEVYSWGLNNYFELGYPTERIKEKIDTFSNEPRRVLQGLKKLKIKGIACSKIHSAAFTDNLLVLWGLNVGQMDFVSYGETIKHGKLKGVVQVPRKLEFPNDIKQVITTDTATIILLVTDECHILTNGSHLRFQLPLFKTLNNEFEYFRPTKFSKKKKIIKLVSKDCTKIGILYDDGSVSNFGVDIFSKASNIKYNTVWSPRNTHLKCHDVDIGQDGSIVICTKAGAVYKRISRMSGKSDYKFTKIARISKIVKVSCDSLFSSFGFIKDDVDQLPLDLAKNQFLVDINYLSPLTPSVANRRQAQLIDLDNSERYVVNYLNKPHLDESDEIDPLKLFKNNFDIEDDEKKSEDDPLFNDYINRWDSPQKIQSTFEKLDIENISNVLQKKDLKYYLITNDFKDGKNYDLEFEIDDCLVGVHKSILFFIPQFHEIFKSNVVIGDVVFGKVEDNIIKVSNLHLQSLLIILNFLYTGSFIKIWDQFTASNTPPLLREVKQQTLELMKSFGLINELQRPTYNIFEKFNNFENFENDVLIKLKDDEEIGCCSYIMAARNAYFETLFSERWDGCKTLEFLHTSKQVFEIALRYIYGYEQLSILDHMVELTSISEFINLQFEVIELSDELMLFGLKDLAQLMIKDFITQDNALLILHHAESLNCNMLIGECLWFIYNNVELFLFDSHYEDLLSQNIIKRIDSYFRWMNRVNKIQSSDGLSYWYDEDSGEAIKKFLNNSKDFNNHFLEDNSFEPLFDIKQVKKDVKASPKLEPKKNKLPSPPPIVNIEKKKSVSIDPLVSSHWSRKTSQVDSSSAIEFTDEDFQPVVSRRRRSSAKRASVSTPTAPSPLANTTPTLNSTPSKNIPIPQSKPIYGHRNSSVSSLVDNMWPGMNGGSSPGGLSPMSNWANSSTTSLNGGGSPSLKKIWVEQPLVSPPSSSSSTSKINFNNSAGKMSQKERKRMMKSNEPESTPSKSKPSTPWSAPKDTSSKKNVSSLLAAQEDALAAEKRTPSLAGIIHEEEHRVLEDVINETRSKSLAEIQQEEEFASWWEAESKKVQQQMNVLNRINGDDKPKGQQKKKNFSSRNRKRSVN